jgi:hypothetical protein
MNKLFLILTVLTTGFQVWAADATRTSSTGTVFVLDSTFPTLGEAYRDPSGLVWGDLAVTDHGALHTTQFNAETYCSTRGARLPTRAEFQRLAQYLGEGSAKGFSPFTTDGETDMFLGFHYLWYWSSTGTWISDDFRYVFYGNTGFMELGNRQSTGGSIHCVIQK